MIEDWLLQPTVGPDPKPVTADVVNVYVSVPGHGGFWVTKVGNNEIRKSFVNGICSYLYGAVYRWQINSPTPE